MQGVKLDRGGSDRREAAGGPEAAAVVTALQAYRTYRHAGTVGPDMAAKVFGYADTQKAHARDNTEPASLHLAWPR